MSLGDYSKTAYVNGTNPALNATNLNNNENKTAELDTAALQASGFHSDLAAWYGNTKLGAMFQTDETWTSGAGTQSADVTNYKLGSQSLKILENDNTASILYSDRQSISLDFTIRNDGSASDDTDYIYFVFYISDVTKVDTGASKGIRVMFSQAAIPDANNKIYSVVSGIATGWNYIKILKSAFSTGGSGAWSGIQSLRIYWYSLVNSINAYVSFQLVQLVKKDPSSAVPNPFQYLSSGTATRRAQITAGEWFAGLENSNLICRNLLAANDDDMLIFTKSFNADFTIHAVMQIKNASDSNNIGFRIDASNRINAYISSDVLYLGSTIAGATTANSTAMAISSGDVVEFEIIKVGTSVTLKAFLNYNRNTVYTPAPASFTPTGTGYLTVGYVSTTEATSNIQSLSIGSVNHARTADYAESFKKATSTAPGIVELATDAEALTGTDTERAVTPAGVRALADGVSANDNPGDTITASGTLTLNYDLGSSSYKNGVCVLNASGYGIMVYFSKTNTESLVSGTINKVGDLMGGAWSRRDKGFITSIYASASNTFGYLATGDYAISIDECYIDGSNLRIDLKNNTTSNATLACDIDWKVW